MSVYQKFSFQQVIDSLTFEPFIFEKEPPWEGAEHMSISEATKRRVRTGAVVRLKDGDVYFVGDCNAILGVCDDCCEFKYEDIGEIAYLWEE